MNNIKKITILTIAGALFCTTIAINKANAQACTTHPTCAQLGYTKSAADCKGSPKVKCPFATDDGANTHFCSNPAAVLSCANISSTACNATFGRDAFPTISGSTKDDLCHCVCNTPAKRCAFKSNAASACARSYYCAGGNSGLYQGTRCGPKIGSGTAGCNGEVNQLDADHPCCQLVDSHLVGGACLSKPTCPYLGGTPQRCLNGGTSGRTIGNWYCMDAGTAKPVTDYCINSDGGRPISNVCFCDINDALDEGTNCKNPRTCENYCNRECRVRIQNDFKDVNGRAACN